MSLCPQSGLQTQVRRLTVCQISLGCVCCGAQWCEVRHLGICKDSTDAAQRGCVGCLKRMWNSGDFLPLRDPNRGSAGEARRLDAWTAGAAACKAGQMRVLSWIMPGCWPQNIDAVVPWDLRDVLNEWSVERHILKLANDIIPALSSEEYEALVRRMVPGETAPTLAEWSLFKAAVRGPSLGCLVMLLDSGCRSPWLCTAAVYVNNVDALRLAMDQGCPCDVWTIFGATCTGNKNLLLQGLLHAIDQQVPNGQTYPPTHAAPATVDNVIRRLSIFCAAKRGYVAFLEVLLPANIPQEVWSRYGVGHPSHPSWCS